MKSLADKMGANIVAEGIQTKEELLTLQKLGINYGQGFLFAKPDSPFPEPKFL